MAKGKKYKVRTFGRSVEMSEANGNILVYRIPYQNLNAPVKKEDLIKIDNPFIVYILFGEDNKGQDKIYVGKSKNGIKDRPTSHEDKFNHWVWCYVLTQFKERTFFNDGTIQYLEHKLNSLINDLRHYDNTTQKTTSGTANSSDEEDCDEYLEKAYEMLDILGLDLITHLSGADEVSTPANIDDADCIVPDGIYTLRKKIKRWGNRTVHARMQVLNGKYIVLEGSEVCPIEGTGLYDAVFTKRKSADITDNILNEEIVFDSPSGAGMLVTGGSLNGWTEWHCADGSSIDKYRFNQTDQK